MRGCLACFNAAAAVSMSFKTALLNPQTDACLITLEISETLSKSPGLEMGNPASIISTPKSSSFNANSIFSVLFSLQPGTCSPSLRVVSKMYTCFSAITFFNGVKKQAAHFDFSSKGRSNQPAP